MFMTAPMFGTLTPIGAASICFGICIAICLAAYVIDRVVKARKAKEAE